MGLAGMTTLTIWAGRAGALVAAALAAAWLWQASPERADPSPQAARCDADRAFVARLEARGLGGPDRIMAEARLAYCPPPGRTAWDTELRNQGLIAGAVAVGLLLLTAVVPQRRRTDPPAPPRPAWLDDVSAGEDRQRARPRGDGHG